MRAKIILILLVGLLFANYANLRSQTTEPIKQPIVYYNDSTYYLDSQMPQFTQSKVFKGWMWGSRYVLSKALFCTQSDNWYADDFTNIVDSANMFVRSNRWQALYCDHGHGDNVLFGRAMVFNPGNCIEASLNASIKMCGTTWACPREFQFILLYLSKFKIQNPTKFFLFSFLFKN